MVQDSQKNSLDTSNVSAKEGSHTSDAKDIWPTGNHRQFGRSLDPLGIIEAVYDKKWYILLATCMAALLAIFFVSLIAPTYKATATIEFGTDQKDLISFDGQREDPKNELNLLQTQIENLRSRTIARRVIDKLNLHQVKEFLPEKADSISNRSDQVKQQIFENEVITRFLENLTIKQIDFTQLLEISFESHSAALATEIANTLASEYIDSLNERKNAITNEAVESISLRLSSLKANLDASERKLLDFKLTNNIIDVEGTVGRLSEQEILLSSSELVTAKSNLLHVANLRSEIKKLENNPELLLTLPQFHNDPLIRQARLDLDDEQRSLRELSNKYGIKHPKIVDANSRISSLKNSLQTYTRQIINRTENEYQQMANRVDLLESKLQLGKSSIQDLGAKKIELNALQNEVSTNREIYNTFFNRMLESNSVQGMERNHANIVEAAYQPTEPSKPRKAVIIFLTLIGALLISSLFAVAVRVLDNTISSTRDVEYRTRLKLLGIVPDKTKKPLKLSFPWTKNKVHDHNESMDVLSANIRMIDKRASNKIIMITSSAPDEGKTTSGLALSIALGKTENVLLIDADLRKGSLTKALGVADTKPGLTDLIYGDIKITDAVHRDENNKFNFISCGTAIDQPLVMLSSKAFERMLIKLSMVYDRIIVDCPPVLAVSDAKIIGALTDSVLYIIKAKQTPTALVNQGVDLLREANAKIMGAVVTHVNTSSMSKFGGVYDFHGFHDYYGYTNTKKPGKILKLKRSDIRRLNNNTDDRKVS